MQTLKHACTHVPEHCSKKSTAQEKEKKKKERRQSWGGDVWKESDTNCCKIADILTSEVHG